VYAYSEDGINWTQKTLPSTGNWMSITYGNGKFVAPLYATQSGYYLVESNVYAYSEDGINWTQKTLPSSQKWYAVTYGIERK
jgi:hypothetical protein